MSWIKKQKSFTFRSSKNTDCLKSNRWLKYDPTGLANVTLSPPNQTCGTVLSWHNYKTNRQNLLLMDLYSDRFYEDKVISTHLEKPRGTTASRRMCSSRSAPHKASQEGVSPLVCDWDPSVKQDRVSRPPYRPTVDTAQRGRGFSVGRRGEQLDCTRLLWDN